MKPTIPPILEYSLTALGRSFLKPAAELARWADANHDHVRSCRNEFDASPRPPRWPPESSRKDDVPVLHRSPLDVINLDIARRLREPRSPG